MSVEDWCSGRHAIHFSWRLVSDVMLNVYLIIYENPSSKCFGLADSFVEWEFNPAILVLRYDIKQYYWHSSTKYNWVITVLVKPQECITARMSLNNPTAWVLLKKEMNFPLTAAIVVSVMLLSKLTHATMLLICVWDMPTDTGWSDQVLRFCMVFPSPSGHSQEWHFQMCHSSFNSLLYIFTSHWSSLILLTV